MKSKVEFRQQYLQRRKELRPAQVRELSLQVAQQFGEWLERQEEANHFHLFFPIARFNEVNTFYIKELLECQGKVLYTSQINKDSLLMDTLKLPQDAVFFLDKWGIPIPQESLRVRTDKIQVVLVPLLAYDHQGNRLGFGKGYYDVFLESLSPAVIKVGLSFFEPELELPADSHDVRLDYCITPKGCWAFGGTWDA